MSAVPFKKVKTDHGEVATQVELESEAITKRKFSYHNKLAE